MSLPMSSVITANLLRTGEVVYLTQDGAWTTKLETAAIAEDDATRKAMEHLAHAALARNEVISVYAMNVERAGSRLKPVSVRENIRAAHAPTI